jgi:hypothetical protein
MARAPAITHLGREAMEPGVRIRPSDWVPRARLSRFRFPELALSLPSSTRRSRLAGIPRQPIRVCSKRLQANHVRFPDLRAGTLRRPLLLTRPASSGLAPGSAKSTLPARHGPAFGSPFRAGHDGFGTGRWADSRGGGVGQDYFLFNGLSGLVEPYAAWGRRVARVDLLESL